MLFTRSLANGLECWRDATPTTHSFFS